MLSVLWTRLRRYLDREHENEHEMIQRRNSRRFVLSELCTEESEAEAESGEPDPSNSQVDSPPPYPTYPPDSPYREAPPTQYELLKWRSIKSLRSQIS